MNGAAPRRVAVVGGGLTAVLNTPRVSLRPRPGGSLAVDADWTSEHITGSDDAGNTVPSGIVEVPGLYVAFAHSGATLGLIAGELLAYEIRHGTGHPLLADFTARRFGWPR